MKQLLLWFIRFYKRYISPILPQGCRFQPTCSEYTYEAVERYGIIYGLRLGIKRIMRCHPWSKGGHDPIR